MKYSLMAGSCIAALLHGAPVLALDAYVQTGVNYMVVRTEGARFTPLAWEGRLGAYIDKQIALEVQASTSIKDSDKLNIQTDLATQYGVSLRLESPEVKGGKLYFLGGYGVTELDIDRSDTGAPGELEYKGGTYGLGTQIRPFKNCQSFSLYLEAKRHFAEDHVKIDHIGLGVGYAF